MAIYGQAFVNGTEIIDWYAQRVGHSAGENTYRVEVRYWDLNVELHTFKGEIQHVYDDGAMVLLSKVMAWADQELRKPKEE